MTAGHLAYEKLLENDDLDYVTAPLLIIISVRAVCRQPFINSCFAWQTHDAGVIENLVLQPEDVRLLPSRSMRCKYPGMNRTTAAAFKNSPLAPGMGGLRPSVRRGSSAMAPWHMIQGIRCGGLTCGRFISTRRSLMHLRC